MDIFWLMAVVWLLPWCVILFLLVASYEPGAKDNDDPS